jgi:dCMP deaminase
MSASHHDKHRERYFATAAVWAGASTCLKRQVGAALVMDGHVIATGYNGSPSGERHCDDPSPQGGALGCHLVDGKCKRAIHAEHNAILQAAQHGHPTRGAVMYVTLEPCHDCQMFMKGAGITEWYWLEDKDDRHAPPVPVG